MNNFNEDKILSLVQIIKNEDIDCIIKMMEEDKELKRVLSILTERIRKRNFAEEKILNYLSKNGKATPKKLMIELDFSSPTIHRNLLILCENKKIIRTKGNSKDRRNVYYSLNESEENE